MVDKNLFLYDLAMVAIMKNEGPYLKEWLDYHLMAGVEHFYIYDNDSSDNQAEVAAPYVEAGIVDYFFAPGSTMQVAVYNDAVKRFKFQCRYMAVIDADEFIFPKTTEGRIAEFVDEIISQDENAAALGFHWQNFGSNGQEKADYSRGVLERFTRRAPSGSEGNNYIKTISNPRKINYFHSMHIPVYFYPFCCVNENLKIIPDSNLLPVEADKIVVNHYCIKSKEEYVQIKMQRGWPCADRNPYTLEGFEHADKNDEFDDGILKYRDARAKIYQPPDKFRAEERLFNALQQNLSPIFLPNTPEDFFAGKMETFLTCRTVAEYLKTRLVNDAAANIFEEAALVGILRSINGMSFADGMLFIRELPNFLNLPYPVVKEIRNAALEVIPQIMETFRMNILWKEYVWADYLQGILKIGG